MIATAKILIEYGAGIHAKNDWGYTIFDILENEIANSDRPDDSLLPFLKEIEMTTPE